MSESYTDEQVAEARRIVAWASLRDAELDLYASYRRLDACRHRHCDCAIEHDTALRAYSAILTASEFRARRA